MHSSSPSAPIFIKPHNPSHAPTPIRGQTRNDRFAAHTPNLQAVPDLSDDNLDKAYMQRMVQGHIQAVALFQNEAKNGKDSQLRAASVPRCRRCRTI
ncbi:MAG: DUF4142 domain-containing protein [Rhodopila sp.]